MEENGIMMPVTDLKCKFLKPARYDELITIRVIIKALPSVRMYFYYEVLDADGNKLNEGETTLVFVNMSSNRPCKAPEYLLEKLSPYFE